ncbi:SLC13 family permease [Desulfosporosinus nitroreducens]|uniref:Sodium-dependent dicarboxylate transporter SdcS n=1 Tax=Desulfosporosinus nitroreducens TaxID=2018668 RepID=A0ABT8QQ64_9FIRM|nr:SLC13 family permease [Desulfosporosinus nitroreducens]MDO0822734.1 anion permease [Desulfosporosinus nitroreducens]
MSQNAKPVSTNLVPNKTNNNAMLILKWIISILVPVIIFMVPESASFTPAVRGFLAITFWGVFCMATEIIPSTLAALMLPVFYILFNVAKPAQAFAPWTSTVIWIAVGGIIIASILMTSGLAKRIAYFTILKSGGSFSGVLIGLAVAGIVINPFVPSVMGKLAIMVPIAIGVCQALGFEPKSKGASAVMLAAFIGIASTRIGFYTGDGGIPMMMNIVAGITKSSVSWTQYAYHNLLISIIFTALSIGIIIAALKPEKVMAKRDVIVEKYAELGLMNSNEKKVAVLLGITILGLVTDSIHKIDPAWIFMVIALITFLPGINLMNEEKLGKLNYKILFFVAGCMAIGTVAGTSGAGKWMADLIFPLLSGASPLQTSVTVWFVGVLLNFALTPLAAMASFTGPITEICIQAGINPLPVIYAFLNGLDQYLLPYEFAGLLFVYSYGYISMNSLVKVIGPKLILSGVFIALIAYPYWKLIGLF